MLPFRVNRCTICRHNISPEKTVPMLRYAITSRAQYAEDEPGRHASVVAQAARVAAEGVEYIQLREKDLPAQDLIGLAREILSAIRSSVKGRGPGTRLLVNSRADVALAAGASGVHLPSGEEQLTPKQVRWLFERAGAGSAVVSVSCHTLAEVVRARDNGADVILFGPVFGKSVDGGIAVPGTGLEALREACAAAGDTPVLALGGVTAANRATTIAAGAAGIAAIRLFR
jgi:thiamine-phosphate pyrophosphorylase